MWSWSLPWLIAGGSSQKCEDWLPEQALDRIIKEWDSLVTQRGVWSAWIHHAEPMTASLGKVCQQSFKKRSHCASSKTKKWSLWSRWSLKVVGHELRPTSCFLYSRRTRYTKAGLSIFLFFYLLSTGEHFTQRTTTLLYIQGFPQHQLPPIVSHLSHCLAACAPGFVSFFHPDIQ